ncbi:VCBS repeat-containing protein [Aliiroseovarius sp. Z3]|uniref:FG-GAP repeat domain-containing protein n=1 Tax=Aliiroseovarius sp. Z3 TaxID=2811402 RepID=UPI0023B2674C|nr:VCBS repeat-containing protein [Aliiroseovarius sp. Z3]MDE9451179.1 VCBS repeat-containing protein [Aliiroseovarius sp. Z3]
MIGLRAALLFFCLATPLAAQITAARYVERTDRYGHGAVPGGEYGAVEVTLVDGTRVVTHATGGVFEDTVPRLHDFDGDGAPEIVTVFSGDDVGAMIRVYSWRNGALVMRGSSPPIGTRHRWLAIAGIADFDGDQIDEIAFVDRPHLARRLTLVSVMPGAEGFAFKSLASAGGVTNHKFGSPVIEGGVRDCAGESPVVVTASANWSRIIETRLDGGELILTNVGRYQGPNSLSARLTC